MKGCENMGNSCSFKYYDGKKTLHGTAAFLKISSENGGIDQFIEDIATEAAKQAVKVAIKEQRKPKLKVV